MSNYSYYRFMDKQYLLAVAVLFLIQIIRYKLMAGVPYYFLFVRNKDKYERRKIQRTPFNKDRIKKEIINSVWFCALSSLFFALPYLSLLSPYSQVYTNSSDHSHLWLWLQIPVLILLNDTYFYWMHRMLHHPKLYWIHKEHHESRDPSPFAAYSFHWLESIFEFAWFIPLMFLIPFHYDSLFIFGAISLLINVNGHLGVDLFPESWAHHPVMKWLNTSTFHNQHHKYFKGNYGFYFVFWDRLMRTQRNLPIKTSSVAAA